MFRTKPYVIDAIIGNRKMLAALTKDGKIHRLWWPRLDLYQQLEEWDFALSIEGYSNLLWLHDKMEWDFIQTYLEDAPVVLTEARHKTLPISWQVVDFILPDRDILVRRFNVKNLSQKAISVKLWQYTNFYIDERYRYNTTQYISDIDGVLHYRANTVIAICSNLKPSAFQCGGDARQDIISLNLNGKSHEMSSSGAVMWDLGVIDEQMGADVELYLIAAESIDEVLKEAKYIKSQDMSQIQLQVYDYWNEIYKKAIRYDISNEKINRLYKRSIMVFHLLSQPGFGGILAAPEMDEDFLYCGGYGFCWGRDAAYITSAIDAAGYHYITEEFYLWAMAAQSEDGSWAQRHYLDGSIAPNWGLQIDETGSILWGIWEHYKNRRDNQFLSKMWPSVKKGADFLVSNRHDYTGLPLDSHDLWEERIGQHTYSAAAVYGGLIGAANIAKELGFDEYAKKWEESAAELKRTIKTLCWDQNTNCFVRSIKVNGGINKDHIVDVSLLGIAYPFNVLDPKDNRMMSTARIIEERLWSPKIGGIKRYEDDIYRGGNPWILTTLWLSLYYTLIDEYNKAKKLFEWAVNHATPMGLFPEQIHRNTGEPAWVVPLTWSHAMFVLVLHKFIDKKILE